MTNLEKNQIQQALAGYCDRFASQNKAANSLKGVSPATISQVMNNKWEMISDDMWRNIASQIGYSMKDWVTVETRDFKLMTQLMEDAKRHANVFAVTGEAGTGKTHVMNHYASQTERTYLLHCNEYWNRKLFMTELLQAMGKDSSGYTVGEIMNEIVSTLKKEERPLLLLDEADKLSDQVLYFFITLYNNLEDHCGIILCATDHLEKRIKRGLKLNKKGYKEIFSRIGRRFIELKGPSQKDIATICQANRVEDRLTIAEIYNESEGDLRRVKRRVHVLKMEAVGVV